MNVPSHPACPRLEWSVDRDEIAGISTVVLSGELDVADAGELAATLAREYCSVMVRLDMAAVTFVDARILSVLVRANHDLRTRAGLLVLADVRPRIQRILRVSGLAGVLRVERPDGYPEPSRAAAAMTRPPANIIA